MSNLENFGVHELNVKEIREIEGGFWPIVARVFAFIAGVHELTCPGKEYHRTSYHAMDRGAW
jgi:hypothetical protein